MPEISGSALGYQLVELGMGSRVLSAGGGHAPCRGGLETGCSALPLKFGNMVQPARVGHLEAGARQGSWILHVGVGYGFWDLGYLGYELPELGTHLAQVELDAHRLLHRPVLGRRRFPRRARLHLQRDVTSSDDIIGRHDIIRDVILPET